MAQVRLHHSLEWDHLLKKTAPLVSFGMMIDFSEYVAPLNSHREMYRLVTFTTSILLNGLVFVVCCTWINTIQTDIFFRNRGCGTRPQVGNRSCRIPPLGWHPRSAVRQPHLGRGPEARLDPRRRSPQHCQRHHPLRDEWVRSCSQRHRWVHYRAHSSRKHYAFSGTPRSMG